MMTNNPIPPATAEKLATEFPKGTRHHAALDIAVSMTGNGVPASGVFATLRDKFPADMTDKELHDIVQWAGRANPTPSTGGSFGYRNRPALTVTKPIIVKSPIEQTEWWASGERMEFEQVVGRSPTPIPESNIEAAQLAIGSLYGASDNINIVCRYFIDDEKARPTGPGKILSRDQWISWFASNGIPQSEAGAWVRLNPCAPVGSGKEGAVTDADVSSFRYLLLESDTLPLPMQFALFTKLRLPIAAIVMSGGSSAHAWVKIDAPNIDRYRELVGRILSLLKPFGIDQANSNPSRLSRLPGARRTLGAVADGIQRLLWLNPSVAPLNDAGLVKFEESLKFPAIEAKPLRSIAAAATDRYETLYENRGKLGVPYGIPELDRISGGMKPGQTVVIAGATGGGKTTFAIHTILSALLAGHGVVLFSLEMDREEIFDQLVSNRCDIDRNKFNNGEFNPAFDFPAMAREMPRLANMPLYIEDNAIVNVDDIRLRVSQLKADNKISLAVVDYVQFVNPTQSRESREQQVAAISHGLRALARDTRVPVIVLSQLNDEGKLRESRVIAHNANVVLVVEMIPSEAHQADDRVLIKVVKGRGIPCGEHQMRFERRFCRLVPIET